MSPRCGFSIETKGLGPQPGMKGMIFMAENNALANTNVRDTLSANNHTAYCSMTPTTMREKAMLFNAMSNPTHKLADYINVTIWVKDVFVELIELTDDLTGETTLAPRIVLIDNGNETFQAVSKGIYNSLSRLIQNFGEPTWDGGLPLRVKQVSKGKNQLLVLEADLDSFTD